MWLLRLIASYGTISSHSTNNRGDFALLVSNKWLCMSNVESFVNSTGSRILSWPYRRILRTQDRITITLIPVLSPETPEEPLTKFSENLTHEEWETSPKEPRYLRCAQAVSYPRTYPRPRPIACLAFCPFLGYIEESPYHFSRLISLFFTELL